MALTIDSPRSEIPERPDPDWAAALRPGDAVAVVDPTPRHIVYLARVARVTPAGILRLVHESGQEAQSFRTDGYIHGRRSDFGFYPRYIVNPDAPAAAAPEADHE